MMTAEERAEEIMDACDVPAPLRNGIVREVICAHIEGHGRQMVLDHIRIRREQDARQPVAAPLLHMFHDTGNPI